MSNYEIGVINATTAQADASEATGELRESLASTLWLAQPEYTVSPWDEISGTTRERYRAKADALLVGPLAPLLARVQAVRSELNDLAASTDPADRMIARQLLRALDPS